MTEAARPFDRPAPPRAPLPRNGSALVVRYLLRSWPQYVGLFLAVTAAAACAVAVQYGMKMLVDSLDGADRGQAWAAFLLFLALIAVESLLWRGSGWFGSRAIIATGVDIRLDLFSYLAGQPLRYFADHLSGALASRVTAVAGGFGALVSTIAWNIIPPCIDFAGALLLFLMVDWRMACALALFVALVAGGLTAIGIRGQPLHRLYAQQASHVGGELVDTISNMWVVKAFAAGPRERARLARKFATEAGAQRRSWLYLEKMRLVHDVALWLMGGGMLAWAIMRAVDGAITAGDVVMVSALTFRVLHGSRDLGLSFTNAAQQVGIIDEALATIGVRHDVVDAPDARPLHPGDGAVRVRGVHFAYPGRPPLFRGLDLDIPAGQKVGIVGRSGAGKSTLIALIQRFYDVQRGGIDINGQPIARVTQDSLRAAIAVVPQDVGLLHRTLAENIRIGRPDATDAEVMEAARRAHCDEFVRGLPNGYETVVGERGVRLSGGQRQRVGIARALLKRAPLVILDEATSALDTESERMIQDALVSLARGRTLIAIAHRLSTLAAFDRIVVLEGGEIVQDGSPAGLQSIEGPFNRLWQLQTARRVAG